MLHNISANDGDNCNCLSRFLNMYANAMESRVEGLEADMAKLAAENNRLTDNVAE